MSAPAGGGGGGGSGAGIAVAVIAGIVFVWWLFSPTVIVHRYEQPQVARQGFQPLARQASLPDPRQAYERSQHRTTRRWAECMPGYDQDPETGDCNRVRWVAGSMPRN